MIGYNHVYSLAALGEQIAVFRFLIILQRKITRVAARLPDQSWDLVVVEVHCSSCSQVVPVVYNEQPWV